MLKSCVGFAISATRLERCIAALVIIAANFVVVSISNAQWVNKHDIDAGVGYPLNYNLVVTAPTLGHYSAPAKVDLTVATKGSYRVILKVYGSGGLTTAPLFAKLMPPPFGTDTSKVFSTDLSHPTDPNYKIPVGRVTLLAEIYHVRDGYFVNGYTTFKSILDSNSIPAGSLPPLWAQRHAAVSADYGVGSFDVFLSKLATANATVVVTPVYKRGATLSQKRALDTKARALADTTATAVADVINGFSLAHFPWRASVSPSSPGIRSIVLAESRPISADRAASFLSSVSAQARTQSYFHPEGVLNLSVTTVQNILN